MKSTLKKVLFGMTAAVVAMVSFTGCPETPKPPKAVTFDPETGAELAVGQEIKLSCETAGADIYYSFETKLTKDNYEEDGELYSEEEPIVATATDEGITIYAVSVNNGGVTESKAEYTVKPVPALTCSVKNGAVVAYGTKVTLTATSAAEGDNVKIFYATQTLSASNYKTVGTIYDADAGIVVEEECTIYAIAEGMNGLSTVTKAAVSIGAEKNNAPAGGDVVVIVAVSHGVAYPSGTATLDDDYSMLTLNSTLPRFTVKKNAAGEYVFVNAEGLFLASAEAGGSFVNKETFDDYCKWVVEDYDKGMVAIYNAAANTSESKQYFEYYSSKTSWSTYGYKSGNDDYRMGIYVDKSATALEVTADINKLDNPEISAPLIDGKVPSGNSATVSAAYNNAEFYVSLNEFTKENYSSVAEKANFIEITGEVDEKVTVYAIAVAGECTSDVISVEFTVGKGADYYTPITDVTKIADGTKVILGCKGLNATATGSIADKYYLGRFDATIDEKGLLKTEGHSVYTVKVVNGGVCFVTEAGKYMTVVVSGTNYNFSFVDAQDDNSVWSFATPFSTDPVISNSVAIKNNGTEKYMEWYTGSGTVPIKWTVYGAPSKEANYKFYDFQLFLVPQE